MTTHSTCLTLLTHTGLIRATGADAAAFLQNQFGNDVNRVDENHNQLNCYASPKGRLLAIFRLFQHEDCFYLRMPKEIVPATLQRLKMFVLMAKVTLEDVSDTQAGLGLAGSVANQTISDCLDITAPSGVNSTLHTNGMSILRVPGVDQRFEIFGAHENITALHAQLQGKCEAASTDTWMLGELQAGIPTVYSTTREEFVPQMVNLQLIDGLSFKKGCYPGQEIVARMHYLGKLKRRMYLATAATSSVAEPGDEIYIDGNTSAVGKLVDARPLDKQTVAALLVAQIQHADNSTLRLGAPDGPALQLSSLPYSFEANND